MRGNGLKLSQEGLKLDIRKKFPHKKILNRLSKGVVEASTLEVFKNMWLWLLRTWFSSEYGHSALVDVWT